MQKKDNALKLTLITVFASIVVALIGNWQNLFPKNQDNTSGSILEESKEKVENLSIDTLEQKPGVTNSKHKNRILKPCTEVIGRVLTIDNHGLNDVTISTENIDVSSDSNGLYKICLPFGYGHESVKLNFLKSGYAPESKVINSLKTTVEPVILKIEK